MSSGSQLLDGALLRRLDQMSVATKSRIRGTIQGKRRSRDLGSSLDFADYRLYSPGDDTRQLDWNAYGRTGKPFIKLFMDEQELQVHLWLDVSQSMSFGKSSNSHAVFSQTKWEYARQLAAGVGYISLNRYDRVSTGLFSDQVVSQLRNLRGRGSAFRLFDYLTVNEPSGAGDIYKAFRNPTVAPKLPGMTWIFSDFLYEHGVQEALTYLLAAKQEVVVVQVLSPEEIEPQLSGELRLIDSETGNGKEVAISSKVLQAYRAEVRLYTEMLKKYCFERGITYLNARTDIPPAEMLLGSFRQSGLLS
jgi:uncharacterized protein (DUF58 family)